MGTPGKGAHRYLRMRVLQQEAAANRTTKH